MQVYTATLLTLAVATYAAASPCSDICNGVCDTVQGSVQVSFPMAAPLVAPNVAACKQACAAFCPCTTACNTRCDAPYNTCVEAANGQYSPVAYTNCQVQYAVCQGPCQFQCSAAVVAGVTQQLQAAVTSASQDAFRAFSTLFGGAAPAAVTQAPASSAVTQAPASSAVTQAPAS